MTCVISIVQKVSFGIFLLRLFVVVVIFYLLGIFVGILFLEALGPEKKPGKADEEASGEGDATAEQEGEGEELQGRPEELENVTEDVSGNDNEEPFADDEE